MRKQVGVNNDQRSGRYPLQSARAALAVPVSLLERL